MISMQQYINEQWFVVKDYDEFWKNVGIFSPFIVDTQAEADYMFAMQLMLGREFVTLVDGKDANTTGYPPTYVKIDIPL